MTPRLRDIESSVCSQFGLTRDQLRSATRVRTIARPRQIALFLARELTGCSFPKIGQYFHRDHCTVILAKKRITALISSDEEIAKQVRECRATIPEFAAARLGAAA